MTSTSDSLVDIGIKELQQVVDLQRRPADDENDENYKDHLDDLLLVLDEVVVGRVRRMVLVGQICVDGQIGQDENKNGK